jgi:hypothetical protein
MRKAKTARKTLPKGPRLTRETSGVDRGVYYALGDKIAILDRREEDPSLPRSQRWWAYDTHTKRVLAVGGRLRTVAAEAARALRR